MDQNISERQIKKMIEKNEKDNQKILNKFIGEQNKLKKEFNKFKLQYNADVKKLEEVFKKALK